MSGVCVRVIERGGLTVSKRRHNLSDESARAAAVLSDWMKVPGLIPENDIIMLFRNKKKRSKKVAVAAASLEHSEVIAIE